MKYLWCLTITALLLSIPLSASAIPIPVDLELQLLVDISGSVDNAEFNLQRTGYANAFASAAIQNKILAGLIGSITAQLIYWSTGQAIAVDWTLIDSVASANAFSAAIAGAARPGCRGNGFDGTRKVMDVSGDGVKNSGANTAAARTAALLAGIDTINGMVIGGDASVITFYQNNVIGGTTPFVQTAANFKEVEAAINTKILKEIAPIPEPSTFVLFGIGILGTLGMAYKRRKKAA